MFIFKLRVWMPEWKAWITTNLSKGYGFNIYMYIYGFKTPHINVWKIIPVYLIHESLYKCDKRSILDAKYPMNVITERVQCATDKDSGQNVRICCHSLFSVFYPWILRIWNQTGANILTYSTKIFCGSYTIKSNFWYV